MGRKGENGRVDWLSQIWLYGAGAWPNQVLQQFCYFYLTIRLQKFPWQTGIQLYTCITVISEARPSILEGQILWIDSFFYQYFFRNFKADDRPVSSWPNHKPEFSHFGSAVLKWHHHTGVHRQFGHFGVFPDRIAISATTWEVPWPVWVHNWPPRYAGVSPQCRFAFAWHKNEIPNAPEKGLLGGPIL